jgi:hypothetical protein
MSAALEVPRVTRARSTETTPFTGSVLVTCAGIIWFAFAADRLFASGHLDPLLDQVWRVSEDPAAVAGQWLVAVLLHLTRRVPESGPQTLVLITVIAGGFTLGVLYWRLRRVHWSVPEALLATAFLAAHPATLMLATTGTPLLLSAMLVGVVILALDRAATVGDAQSLMALGLALAALVLTSPDALYIALPMVALLPLCLRDVRDSGSALALFMLTLFPAVVAVGGILLAAATFGEAPAYAFRRWLAPMHGVIEAADVPWLVRFGGSFFAPLGVLLPLTIVAMPPALLALVSLLMRPEERERPVTAVLALVGAPLAGAGATLFWHTAGPLPALATGMAAVIAWTSSRALQSAERMLWLIWLFLGVVMAWFTPWVWTQLDRGDWRAALLGW